MKKLIGILLTATAGFAVLAGGPQDVFGQPKDGPNVVARALKFAPANPTGQSH